MEHRALDGRAAIVTGAGEESVRPSPPPSPKLAPTPHRAHEAGHVTHEHGVRAIELEVDVSDTSAVDRATQQTQTELGPVDVLVNNAAIDPSVRSSTATSRPGTASSPST